MKHTYVINGVTLTTVLSGTVSELNHMKVGMQTQRLCDMICLFYGFVSGLYGSTTEGLPYQSHQTHPILYQGHSELPIDFSGFPSISTEYFKIRYTLLRFLCVW